MPRRARIIRGDMPTDPMPMMDLLRRSPYRHARIPDAAAEERQVRRGLELAVRVGETMLRSGAGAPQVEGSIAAVAAAAGVDRVELDITMQSVLAQAHSSDGRAHTVLRVVRHTRFDYARLTAVHQLVQSLVAGDLTVPEASDRLREIERHRRNFSVNVLMVANAVLASAVAVIIGAGAVAALVTVLVVLAVQGVNRLHQRVDLPEFYGNAINAFTATLLAGGCYALGATDAFAFTGRDFAFVVAGGIVAMLPGRTMASAIEDVIFGYPLTGAGRLLAVFLSLTGLIIGIAAGLGTLLNLTQLFEATFVSPTVLDLRVAQAPLVPALVASLVVGLAAAVTVQSRWRLILPTGGLTLVGVGTASLLVGQLGFGPITGTGVAAVAVGFAGRFLAQRMAAPSLVVVVPASFGLLPGLTIFRGLYEMVAQGSDRGLLSLQSGITTLLSAGAVLLAIATGSVLGEFLASPWDARMRGWSRRAGAARAARSGGASGSASSAVSGGAAGHGAGGSGSGGSGSDDDVDDDGRQVHAHGHLERHGPDGDAAAAGLPDGTGEGPWTTPPADAAATTADTLGSPDAPSDPSADRPSDPPADPTDPTGSTGPTDRPVAHRPWQASEGPDGRG